VPFSVRANSKGTIRAVPAPSFHLQIGLLYYSSRSGTVDVINDSLVNIVNFVFGGERSGLSWVIDHSRGGTCTSTRVNTISDSLFDIYTV
jgi:hypothetical protein